MKRLIFALIMALLFFVLLNFIYCNLGGDVFGYNVSFKFSVPYVMSLKSAPMPMGFVVLIAFCVGMLMIALLEALPSLSKTFELRSKNKKIRQLERELTVVRSLCEKSDAAAAGEDKESTPGSPS
jgi:uncharacterized integral membrane protein